MTGPCAVCERPSRSICGGCKLLYYCGRDHQRSHWTESHKHDCRPLYRLAENDKIGRHLVATRDIRRGDVIFREAPLVVGPKSVSQPVCLGCHGPCDPGHECDGCGFPLCSPRCQVSDDHVDECRVMMEAGFRVRIDPTTDTKEVAYFPIVPLRCLLLRRTHPERYKKLANLQSHLEERLNTTLFSVYRQNVVSFIRDRLRVTEFDDMDILRVAGILDTNAFEVRTPRSKVRGLYSTASMLTHNCRPNTKHSFLDPDKTIVVTATTDIPAGAVITATYTQTFWDTLSRRSHLRSAKCFDCDCERCSDPTELGTYAGAIRCVKCATASDPLGGPYVLPRDPLRPDSVWSCESCGREMTAKQIRSGNENLKEELNRPGAKTVEGLEGFLHKYGAYESGVLHPRNFNVVQVKHALVQIIGNREGHLYSDISDDLLNRKIEYCHELLDFIDVVDPGFSRIRGEILNELQAAMVIQTKREYNQGKITKEAAQTNLMNALVILKEVIEILRLDMNVDEFESRVMAVSKELDD